MKFEEALIELRKGKKIKMSIKDFIIFSLNDDHGYCLGVNDFVHEEWEVLEEPVKTFPEVFEAFKEGRKIRRKEWMHSMYFKRDDRLTTDLNPVDLLSNDWEIIS